MYDNIGGKIKGLAKFLFLVDALAAVVSGIVMMGSDDDLVGLGFLVIFGGVLIAWVSTWLLYGFGQLIENSDIIAQEFSRKNEKYEKKVAQKLENKKNLRRKEAIDKIENVNIDDEEFVDVTCPGCHEELSFTKGQLRDADGVKCPFCDSAIVL